jgi:hypothetical protein
VKEHDLWYGYLEAGAKSTPVLRDRQLETGNPKTLYLFNLQKGEILEYSREVAESKLRSLTAEEAGIVEHLAAAYAAARSDFKPRGAKTLSVPERRGRTARRGDALDLDEAEAEQGESEGSDEVLGADVDAFEDS